VNEIEALVALSEIPHLGAIKTRLLVERFGSAQEALHADKTHLAELPGFGPKLLEQWGQSQKSETWKQSLKLAGQQKIQIIPYNSPEYPKRLLETPDHPALLYVKGKIVPQDQHCIAIVGTRSPSPYGQEMAQTLAMKLASAGFTIVSGLAHGIDTAAHQGALKQGRTLAVMGSGLANIYPTENQKLAETIAQQGALISEFSMTTRPDRQNFPQRNRIVSGMTLATLLIEAPVKSGSMITMKKALTQKRKLFALPGRADNENFRGNHLLIKEGQATLVESAEDILASFQFLPGMVRTGPLQPERPPLEPEESELLRLMPEEEVSIEEIVQKAKLPMMKINLLLMSLVVKRAVKESPGKRYKKLNA